MNHYISKRRRAFQYSIMAISTVEFSTKGAKIPSSKALLKVQAGMQRDGVVAFNGLFPMSLLNNLRREVLRGHANGLWRAHGLVRDIAGRYAAIIPFKGPFLTPDFYANPKLRKILAALLGDDYRIGSLETVIAMPGAYEQHQHIDGPVRFDRSVNGTKSAFSGDLSKLPPYAVTLCVPLCDVNDDNGPTAIWPGSHRRALRARPPGKAEILREYSAVHMVGEFGRTFLFDFRTYHCGMPNFTREPRAVLMFVFTRSWFRDPNLAETSPNVIISKRDLQRVPMRHRRLFALAPHFARPLWKNFVY